jgi:hypothetical protein
MLRSGSIVTAFVSILLSAAAARGQTRVCEDITANTTWARAESPYLVTCIVHVYGTPSVPAVLTIEPGVKVLFDDSAGIQFGMDGKPGGIRAVGLWDQQILFSAAFHRWFGLFFSPDAADGECILDFCTVEYAGWFDRPEIGAAGISILRSSPDLHGCTIRYNRGYGCIWDLGPGDHVDLNGTYRGEFGEFLDNQMGGLLVKGDPGNGSAGGVAWMDFIENDGDGLSHSSTGSLDISDCFFQGNGGFGVKSGTSTTRIYHSAFQCADSFPYLAELNLTDACAFYREHWNSSCSGKGILVIQNDPVSWTQYAPEGDYVIGTMIEVGAVDGGANLVLEPGAKFHFLAGTGIHVGSEVREQDNRKGTIGAAGTVENPVIFDALGPWNGLSIHGQGGEGYNLFDNCLFDCSGGTIEGAIVSLLGADAKFSNCRLIDNGRGVGLIADLNEGPLHPWKPPMVSLSNVLVAGNDFGISTADTMIEEFVNCTIAGNYRGSLSMGLYPVFKRPITNTIIWANGAMPDRYLGEEEFACCDIEGPLGLAGKNGNFCSDPLLDGGFCLQASSPCIDAGTSDGAPFTDLRGLCRPAGRRVDIGACEYGALPCNHFMRGDANTDGSNDIGDAMEILSFLFTGGIALRCQKAGDFTDDGKLDISDSVALLSHLFLGGEAPPKPFLACGTDPTPDQLSCDWSPACR